MQIGGLLKDQYLKNVIFSGLAKVITFPLGLVVFIMIGNRLGVAALGLFNFGFSFTVFSKVLVDWGFAGYLPREVARNRERALSLTLMALVYKVLAFLPYLWITQSAVHLFGYSGQQAAFLRLFSAYVLTYSWQSSTDATLHGLGEIRFYSVVFTVTRLVETTITIAALWSGAPLEAVVMLMCLGNVARAAWSLWRISRGAKIDRSFFVPTEWVRAIKASFPFVLGMSLTDMYAKSDVVIMGRLLSTSLVGLYSAMYKFIEMPLALPGVLMSIAYPALAHIYFRGELDKLTALARSTFLLVYSAAAVISAGVILFGGPLVATFYGDRYHSGVYLLQVLGLYITLASVNICLSYFLRACNREQAWVRVSLLGLVVNLLLNFVLIPRMGIVGAAWATTLAEALICFAYMRVMVGAVPGAIPFVSLGWSTVIIVGAAVISQWCGTLTHWLVGAIILALLTAAGLFGLKIIRIDSFRELSVGRAEELSV